jgi:biotin carboxyl carrier protein
MKTAAPIGEWSRGWSNCGDRVKYTVTVSARSFEIEVEHDRLVRVNGRSLYVDLEQVGGLPVYSLALDDEGYVVFVEKGEDQYQVEVQGQVYPVAVQSQRPQLAPQEVQCSGAGKECLSVSAPLAGYLVSLPGSVGDHVQAGQILAVVESMKMKMELKAPQTGIVDGINGPAQRDVAQGEVLVTLQVG